MSTSPIDSLRKAIDICGSQAELARRIAEYKGNPKVRQAHVWNWLNRDQEVPAHMVIAVEQVTRAPDGSIQVSRGELRPDIYPAATERAA